MNKVCEDDTHNWRKVGDGWAVCRKCGIDIDIATLKVHGLI